MTPSVDHLAREYASAWHAGTQPCLDDYLARATAHDRDALVTSIGEFLDEATPPPSSPASDDPLLQAALATADALDRSWPHRLHTLRADAGLTPDDLATGVAARLGLSPSPRLATRLAELEDGTIDPHGLADRLVDAIGAALGVARIALPSRPLAPSGAFRADDPAGRDALALRLDEYARAALVPADETLDEVDRLFLAAPGDVRER